MEQKLKEIIFINKNGKIQCVQKPISYISDNIKLIFKHLMNEYKEKLKGLDLDTFENFIKNEKERMNKENKQDQNETESKKEELKQDQNETEAKKEEIKRKLNELQIEKKNNYSFANGLEIYENYKNKNLFHKYQINVMPIKTKTKIKATEPETIVNILRDTIPETFKSLTVDDFINFKPSSTTSNIVPPKGPVKHVNGYSEILKCLLLPPKLNISKIIFQPI